MNALEKKIQIQIVTHNNQATLEKCLKSLVDLKSEILIIDHDSVDGTVDIAKKYGRVIKVDKNESRSEARNRAVRESKLNWHLWFEPWETLKSGHSSILSATSKGIGSHRMIVSHTDLVTKPIRMWHKETSMKFCGYCYESLFPENSAKPLNVLIASGLLDTSEYQLDMIKKWLTISPTSAEPFYYEAMFFLSTNKYDNFICSAEKFLFRSDKMSMSVIMIRFYLAWVYTLIKKDARQGFANLVVCLSLKPMMAEFWCLLGDIHYFVQKDFDKAYRFYDSALLLGSKRNTGDEWPVQLSRYLEYPKKMMESCKNIIASRMVLSQA
jgi:glycosyltransferase involved in cell wall biosynthesis